MSELMSPSWVSVPIRADGSDEIVGYRPVRYDQFVLALFKKMSEERMLGHAGRGVCTEAGEINDCIKKSLDYDQELNIKNLIEEIGDMRFYLQAIQNMYGLTDAVILQSNASKLSERYMNLRYSDEQAKLRRDKLDGSPEQPS